MQTKKQPNNKKLLRSARHRHPFDLVVTKAVVPEHMVLFRELANVVPGPVAKGVGSQKQHPKRHR